MRPMGCVKIPTDADLVGGKFKKGDIIKIL